MIKAVYFDYHGVLDRRNYHGLVRVIAEASGKPPTPELESRVYDYATGLSGPAEFWLGIQNQYGPDAAKIGAKYYLHVDPIRETWEIVNQLRGKVFLGMCSDSSLDKKEAIRNAYDLPNFFDDLLFSCDVRMTKQDPQFYLHLTRGNKFKPNEVLLIDDNPNNIATVGRQGFAGHVFTTPGELRKVLGGK